MKRILITGASGFVGSWLVDEGIKRQHEIYAGVRITSDLSYLSEKPVTTLFLDLSDKEQLKQEWEKLKFRFGRFDHVIHCAGATVASSPEAFNQINNLYTQNLYDSLIEADFKPLSFVFISSLAVNGPGNSNNMTPLQLTDIPRPVTAYGKSKLAAENFIRKSEKIPYLIFRPTGIYGPRDKGYLSFFKAINSHIAPFPAGSKQLLSFIYVKDLAGIIFLALNSRVKNNTYIVSDGYNYTSQQFATLSSEILNKRTFPLHLPGFILKPFFLISEKLAARKKRLTLLNMDKYRELTSTNWSCSSWELQAEFNFAPRYTLQEGVEETIKWYKKHKWL